MVGRVIYAAIGSGALLAWVLAALTGWGLGEGTSYSLPPSIRQAPGGYRSFSFWHAGYQPGK